MLEAQASVCVVPSARIIGSRPRLMAQAASVIVVGIRIMRMGLPAPPPSSNRHRSADIGQPTWPQAKPFAMRGYAAYCAHGRDAPTAIDELAGQPGPDRRGRERSGARFLRALPGAGPRTVARDGLHRHAASDLRGPRLSLERRRYQ